jgi:hypothetical protein
MRMRLTSKQPASFSSQVPVSTPSLASQVPVLTPPGTVSPPKRIYGLIDLRPHQDWLRRNQQGISQARLLKHLKDTCNVYCPRSVLRKWVWAEKKKVAAEKKKFLQPYEAVLQMAADVAVEKKEFLQPYEAALRGQVAAGLGRHALQRYLRTEHGVECPDRRLQRWLANEKRRAVASAADLAPYTEFLRHRFAEGAGDRRMCSLLKKEHGLQCGRQSMRTWMAQEKSRDKSGDASHLILLTFGKVRCYGKGKDKLEPSAKRIRLKHYSREDDYAALAAFGSEGSAGKGKDKLEPSAKRICLETTTET